MPSSGRCPSRRPTALVGIDEGDVEAGGGAGRQLGVERHDGGPEPEVDLRGHACGRPERLADVRPGLAHVAGEQVAVFRQGKRHRQCAVAGEDADLDGAAYLEQVRQKAEELPLVGADLHAGMRQRSRVASRRPACAGCSRTPRATT